MQSYCPKIKDYKERSKQRPQRTHPKLCADDGRMGYVVSAPCNMKCSTHLTAVFQGRADGGSLATQLDLLNTILTHTYQNKSYERKL